MKYVTDMKTSPTAMGTEDNCVVEIYFICLFIECRDNDSDAPKEATFWEAVLETIKVFINMNLFTGGVSEYLYGVPSHRVAHEDVRHLERRRTERSSCLRQREMSEALRHLPHHRDVPEGYRDVPKGHREVPGGWGRPCRF